MNDEQREATIAMYRQLMEQARDRDEKRRFYNEMKRYVDERTPEQVARMETAQGLR